MPKINTSVLHRAPTVTESRTITDPLVPDVPITLTLASKPDYSEALKVQALSDKYIKEFAGSGKVPIQIDGQDIDVLPGLCVVIALIQTLEQPQEDGSRYSFEDWARIQAGMPNAFGEIAGWAKELMTQATSPKKAGEVEVPNGSAA